MSGPDSKRPGAGGSGGSAAAKRRIAQQRAAQAAAKKAKDRRRRIVVVTSVTVVVALIAGGALALVGLVSGNGGGSTTASDSQALPAAIASEVTNVPASVLDKIGAEDASVVVPTAISAPALTANGKPQILYVGAEYCPYCATERWPMVVALSRFGRFSNLGATASDSTDVYPNTQTLSFHGASYTSSHLDFVAKETENAQGQQLDKLTSAEQSVLQKYDAPPYVPGATDNPIPFVDIGGRFLISGAQYDPQLLQGKTRAQIAAAIADPSSAIGKAAGTAANEITAAICKITKGAPASVCTAPGVVQAAAKLK